MSAGGASGRGDGNYRIEVADFGPIRRASVDLRPLTVFAGPSNTGKSYLAMLVYALHQCFSPSSVRLPRHRRPYWFIFSGAMAEPLLEDGALVRRIAKWSSISDTGASEPPDDVAKALHDALEQVAGGDHHLTEEIRRCFGVDAVSDLIRKGDSSTAAVIALQIPKEVERSHSRYRIELGPVGLQVSGKIEALPEVGDEEPPDFDDPRFLVRSVLHRMFRSVVKPLVRRAYYLPADRTGVMHSHRVVVSTLIQNATGAGIRPSASVPLLSGVLADFLDGLIGAMGPAQTSSRNLADVLERNLLDGSVLRQRPESGYPSFAYRPAEWDSVLPLMRTSSMVSELAPVVLYLRYLVEPNDVLIIEEPESHLHPALQTRFVRELARLVHSGVRVVLTTHSEWILEALANLVRLSELSDDRREGIPGAEVALAPDQVGAWLFKPGSEDGGSEVVEIPLDTDAGSFPAGFGEITEALYNEWARISNRIEAAKANRND